MSFLSATRRPSLNIQAVLRFAVEFKTVASNAKLSIKNTVGGWFLEPIWCVKAGYCPI
jgi:hypothetical protein